LQVTQSAPQLGAWNDRLLISSGPVTAAPAMWMLPLLGTFSPVASFMKLLLPQPQGADDGDELTGLHLQRDIFPRNLTLRQQRLVVGQQKSLPAAR
jgi:hypothetical protein